MGTPTTSIDESLVRKGGRDVKPLFLDCMSFLPSRKSGGGVKPLFLDGGRV